MKKTLLATGILGVIVLTMGFAGFSYAQTQGANLRDLVSGTYTPGLQTPDDEEKYPLRHSEFADYLHDAIADAFGLTSDELTAERDAGNSLHDIAKAQGFTVEDFRARLESAWEIAINNALADEAITEEQAKILTDRSENGFQGFGLQEHGQGPDLGRNRLEPKFHSGFAGDGIIHDIYAQAMEAVLGMTPEELQTQIKDGTTFLEILEAQGLTLDEYHILLSEAVTEAVNQAVLDGLLTQVEADRILQMLDRIEGFGPHPGFGPGPDFGPGMEKGPGSEYRPDHHQNPDLNPDGWHGPGSPTGQSSGKGNG